MTHEISGPSQPFANSYPVPQDQVEFEMNLIDQYASQFPDSQLVLTEALSDVQRYAGINIPRYKLIEPLSEGAEVDDAPADEDGYFPGEAGDNGYSMLMLKMPVNHSAEQIAAMSEEEKIEAGATHTGFMVVGEIPEETSAMLNGVYGLIGAETIRDDRTAGEKEGMVLRLGVYQGEPIYVAEEFVEESPYYGGKPTITVRLVGKNSGEQLAKELTKRQFDEFAATVGSPKKARDMIFENGITADNYLQVSDLISQTRELDESTPAHEPLLLEAGDDTYDDLLDPNVETAQTISATQAPLTDDQIRKLDAKRGHFTTAEEIEWMNKARARGIHHSIG